MPPKIASTSPASGGGGAPDPHAASHEDGGSDELELAPSQITGTAIVEGDSRLTDARTPTSHASTHASAGSDPVTIAQSQVTGLTASLTAKADAASSVMDGDTAGGVLAGTYPNPSFAADMATQAELDAHTGDASAAHAASAISFSPTGTIAATDVQAAIAEVASEAAAGAGTTHTIVRKSADESVTSSATYQNDDHLLFAIGASEVWTVTFDLTVDHDLSTQGFKAQVSAPAGATITARMVYNSPGDSATTATRTSTANPAALGAGTSNIGVNNVARITATIVNSSTAGNVNLMWAQNTSSANATTVKAGSIMVAHKLA